MNRMWNEKHDCMTLYNRPMLTADKDFPNVTNIKCRPGQILPFSVRPIVMGSPPISFDDEMENCRIVAEQRIAVPDFSLGSRAMGGEDKKSNPTATEVNALMSTTGQVVDMRARTLPPPDLQDLQASLGTPQAIRRRLPLPARQDLQDAPRRHPGPDRLDHSQRQLGLVEPAPAQPARRPAQDAPRSIALHQPGRTRQVDPRTR